MTTPLRRRAAAVSFVLALCALTFGSTATASADPVIPINWNVKATTTLKTLGQTVDVPQGTFVGSVDLGTGNLTGDIDLPPASSTMKLIGLPLATATFAMTPAAPVQGHVDLATMTATVTSSFNIRITSLKPSLLPINLVGRNCRTSTPVTVTMSGPVSLTGPSTFNATYTIPKFKDCGLATLAINLVVPGPGNTFSATFGPA